MSLNESQIAAAAEAISRGRSRQRQPIGELPGELQPRDVDEAMAIQDALHPLLTERGLGPVVGTKIGCTTKVMQEYLGMTHPCAGAIFSTTVRDGDGSFDFDSFLHVGVECEIAVRLSEPILRSSAAHTFDSVSECVEAFFPAIEIVDDRYEDFVARRPDWRTWVADDFFGAGIVLGPAVTDWRQLDLADLRGVMKINDVEVGAGHGRDIINGHPLEALVWLANHESKRGRDLPSGWVVMLGSVVQTKWVARGDVVQVELEGLGRAAAKFV